MSTVLGITLPNSWSAAPLKHVTSMLNRGSAPDYVDVGPVRAISQASNQASGLDWSRTRFHDFSGNPKNLKGHLRQNDVLINSTGTGTLGRVGYFTDSPDGLPCMADSHVTIARAKPDELDARFSYYWLRSRPFQEYVYAALVVGATNQIELNRDRLGDTPVPLPPLEEQRRIADFLDTETARIDRMTELRREQSRLWRARYEAFLYEQFMDRSAVENETRETTWLGPVPRRWSAPTIGRISRFTMGTTFPHEYQGLREGDFPFIKVGDFQLADEVGNLDTAENWISRETARQLGARIVPPGSVLYARVGAALLLNRRRITTRPSVVDDNVRAITFTDGAPHYWGALLSLLDMGQLVNPGPVPSIGESQVAAVRVPTAPRNVQTTIADRVVQHQKTLHRIKASIDRQVDLLAERRQALITAAVTGQFDVSTASGRNVTDGVTA
ncbi:restriction endonuclease subunit S [Streptomyces sp. NPDC007907]|uniref:restriction endonuclease subunit S n=1 Tax=Streptomyces sp. NPDC007907 TaxID=3364789 RepID=UPI0036E34A4C